MPKARKGHFYKVDHHNLEGRIAIVECLSVSTHWIILKSYGKETIRITSALGGVQEHSEIQIDRMMFEEEPNRFVTRVYKKDLPLVLLETI